MDPSEKVSRWLKKATKLKETDLPEAIKLIRKAHDELEYEDPSQLRDTLTKLAFYCRLNGDFDSVLTTLLNGFQYALESGDYNMKVMEASILISRLAYHLNQIRLDENYPDFFGNEIRKTRAQNEMLEVIRLLEIESDKLLIIARAAQGRLNQMSAMEPKVKHVVEADEYQAKFKRFLKSIDETGFQGRWEDHLWDWNKANADDIDSLAEEVSLDLENIIPQVWRSEILTLKTTHHKCLVRPRKRKNWDHFHLSGLITVYFPPLHNDWLNSGDMRGVRDAWQEMALNGTAKSPQAREKLRLQLEQITRVQFNGFHNDNLQAPFTLDPARDETPHGSERRDEYSDTYDLIDFAFCGLKEDKLRADSKDTGLVITFLATKHVIANQKILRKSDDEGLDSDPNFYFQLEPYVIPTCRRWDTEEISYSRQYCFFEKLVTVSVDVDLGKIRNKFIEIGQRVHEGALSSEFKIINSAQVQITSQHEDIFLD